MYSCLSLGIYSYMIYTLDIFRAYFPRITRTTWCDSLGLKSEFFEVTVFRSVRCRNPDQLSQKVEMRLQSSHPKTYEDRWLFRAFGDIQSYFVLLGAQHQWTIVQAGGLLKNRAIPMGKELQPYSVKCRVCSIGCVECAVWRAVCGAWSVKSVLILMGSWAADRVWHSISNLFQVACLTMSHSISWISDDLRLQGVDVPQAWCRLKPCCHSDDLC